MNRGPGALHAVWGLTAWGRVLCRVGEAPPPEVPRAVGLSERRGGSPIGTDMGLGYWGQYLGQWETPVMRGQCLLR